MGDLIRTILIPLISWACLQPQPVAMLNANETKYTYIPLEKPNCITPQYEVDGKEETQNPLRNSTKTFLHIPKQHD